MGELRGIYIDTQSSPFPTSGPGLADDKLSSSGVSSATGGSTTSNNNYTDLPRKRTLSPDAGDLHCGSQLDDFEMEKLRCLMSVNVDGDRRSSGSSIPSSHRGSIEPSLMSTVFAVVLVLIISISVYTFTSLFRAVIKRMNP